MKTRVDVTPGWASKSRTRPACSTTNHLEASAGACSRATGFAKFGKLANTRSVVTDSSATGAGGVVASAEVESADSFAGVALSNARTVYVYLVAGASPVSEYRVAVTVATRSRAAISKHAIAGHAGACIGRSLPLDENLGSRLRRGGYSLRHARCRGVSRIGPGDGDPPPLSSPPPQPASSKDSRIAYFSMIRP